MPLSLHPNASAISDWYASGCSATYAFSFSGSIFRKPRCSSFFPKSPVSFSCFSHSCIVDLDTLNVWWVSSSVCPACRYSIVRSLYQAQMYVICHRDSRYHDQITPEELSIKDEVYLRWNADYEIWHDQHWPSGKSLVFVGTGAQIPPTWMYRTVGPLRLQAFIRH